MSMSYMMRLAPAAKAASPFTVGRFAFRSCAGLSDVTRQRKVWNIEYVTSQPTESQQPQNVTTIKAEHSKKAGGLRTGNTPLQQTSSK